MAPSQEPYAVQTFLSPALPALLFIELILPPLFQLDESLVYICNLFWKPTEGNVRDTLGSDLGFNSWKKKKIAVQ